MVWYSVQATNWEKCRYDLTCSVVDTLLAIYQMARRPTLHDFASIRTLPAETETSGSIRTEASQLSFPVAEVLLVLAQFASPVSPPSLQVVGGNCLFATGNYKRDEPTTTYPATASWGETGQGEGFCRLT
ncbi:Ribose-phosphate pyrophosphokinase 2 [Venturia inaequalis]|nr:Ribose-phosphate pyrophosphokinase 2 [Venturia inaequalis]